MQIDCFMWQEHRFPVFHAFVNTLNTQNAQRLLQLTLDGLSFSKQKHLPNWQGFTTTSSNGFPRWLEGHDYTFASVSIAVCLLPILCDRSVTVLQLNVMCKMSEWLQYSVARHFIIFLTLSLHKHHEVYPLTNFKGYNTLLLTIGTILYNRSLEFLHLF